MNKENLIQVYLEAVVNSKVKLGSKVRFERWLMYFC